MPGLNETSLATYQNFDGANTTMLLRSFSTKPAKGLTLTGGFGGSTNFKGTNAFVLEGKAKYAIDEHFSFQLRSRNSFASGNSASQVRLSPGYKTNVSKDVSIYANPYVSAKYKFNDSKLTTDVGAFAGATYKIAPEYTVSGEVQKYNGLDCGAENWGVNVIFSHTF